MLRHTNKIYAKQSGAAKEAERNCPLGIATKIL
jgi:hypothetical protein